MVIIRFGKNSETLYLFFEPKPHNMKKWIIGSLVGAIIVFAWQAASWMFIGIHDKAMKYTPAQDQIMNVLSSSNLDEANYMLPSAPTKQGKQDMMKSMEGKPWASVIYHKSMSTD